MGSDLNEAQRYLIIVVVARRRAALWQDARKDVVVLQRFNDVFFRSVGLQGARERDLRRDEGLANAAPGRP